MPAGAQGAFQLSSPATNDIRIAFGGFGNDLYTGGRLVVDNALYGAADDLTFVLQGTAVSGPPVSAGINSPVERQVIQRSLTSNTANIPVSGDWPAVDSIEARAVVMPGGTGTTTTWATLVSNHPGGSFASAIDGVAAGGWYQLEVRGVTGGVPGMPETLERVGVGDVFIIAGQSNSANHGYPAQTVVDDRVSAVDYSNGAWVKAADPLPGATSGAGSQQGSPWTRLGDLVTASENIPVAFMSVGVGGTEVQQWTPGQAHYPRIRTAVQAFPVGGFRALLWHQGEKDSNVGTAVAAYTSRLQSTIAQSRTDAGWDFPWYVSEVGFNGGTIPLLREIPVVAGQLAVIHGDPLVFPGASTDDFHQENKLYDQVHFNAAGLADHAQQWHEILYTSPPLAPKNGDFEANGVLAEGARHIIDTSIGSSPSIISWRALAPSGQAVAAGSAGYYNPDSSLYPGADDASGTAGVAENMDGKHVAFLDGNEAGTHFLQTRRALLVPGQTYTLTVALGLRNTGTFGRAKLEILADATALGSRTLTTTDLHALAGGSATGKFTDVSLAVTAPPAAPEGQSLSIRITKLDGAGTYLDVDHVRLEASTSAYAVWQVTHWGSVTDPDAAWEANPDQDAFANGLEFYLNLDPAVGNDATSLLSNSSHSGKDWTSFTVPLNPAIDTSGASVEYSFDLNTWIPAASNVAGTVISTKNPSSWNVDVSATDHQRAFFRILASP